MQLSTHCLSSSIKLRFASHAICPSRYSLLLALLLARNSSIQPRFLNRHLRSHLKELCQGGEETNIIPRDPLPDLDKGCPNLGVHFPRGSTKEQSIFLVAVGRVPAASENLQISPPSLESGREHRSGIEERERERKRESTGDNKRPPWPSMRGAEPFVQAPP